MLVLHHLSKTDIYLPKKSHQSLIILSFHRSVVFKQIAVDQAQRQNLSSVFLPGGMVESVNPCLILIVRRENIVEDTVAVLRKSKNVDYKKPLKVMASPCIFHSFFFLTF